MRKILKPFAVCFMLCAMVITMCACSLFGDPAFVDEQGWADAFSYNKKVVITQNSQSLGSATIYRDGYKIKKETVLYGVDQSSYYNFDGEKYWSYTQNTNSWIKEEITKEKYDYESGNLNDSLQYSSFKFSDEDGVFKAENIYVNTVKYSSVVVLFTNKKLDTIELLSNGVESLITYNYKKSFTVTIPGTETPGDSESDSAKVTLAEWNQQFSNDGKYTITQTVNGESTVVKRHDKMAEVSINIDGKQTQLYFNYENSEFYMYMQMGEEWIKTSTERENYELVTFRYLKDVFKYEKFTYNNIKKCYEATNLTYEDETYKTVEVKFVNKKLSTIKATDKTNTVATIQFNHNTNFTITLPEVSGGVTPPVESGEEITAAEWNAAVNYDGKVYFEYAVMNDFVTVKYYQDETKIKVVVSSIMTTDEETEYVSKEGSTYWNYYMESGTYVKEEISASDYNEVRVKHLFNSYVGNMNSYTYNEQEGAYTQTSETGTVTVVFANKKIVNVIITDSSMGEETTTTLTVNYDADVSFELPSVGGGSVNPPEQGVGKISESEWDAALNYNGKYVITQEIQNVGSATVYVDGNKAKSESNIYNINQTVYIDFDGTDYWQYSVHPDDKVWIKTELAEEQYNDSIGRMGNQFKYNSFTYNQEDGVFEAANVTVADGVTYDLVVIGFNDDKLLETISLIANGMTSTITYDYNNTNFTITLPVEGESYIPPSLGGEEVTAAEWNAAINYDGKLYAEMVTMGGLAMGTYYQDETKMKIVASSMMSSGAETKYFSIEGSKYWNYYMESGTYVKEEISAAEYNEYRVKTIFVSYVGDYSSYTYNAQEGAYIQTSSAGTAKVVFANKKIVSVVFEEMATSITVDYDANISFELPSVGGGSVNPPAQGPISEKEWEDSFNFAEKYTITQKTPIGNIIIKVDGNKVEHSFTGFMYFDGEKYYEYMNVISNGIEAWERYEIDEEEFNSTTFKNNELKYMYNYFTYDSTIQMYKLTSSASSTKVSFDNNKRITQIIIDGITMTFDYSTNFTVTLPEIDNGEVTENEWYDLLSLTGINKYSYFNGLGTRYIDGNVYKFEYFDDEIYFEKSGSKYYKYSLSSGGNWTKEETDEDEFKEYFCLDWSNFLPFEYFTFNSEDCVYESNNLEQISDDYTWAEVSFLNKKVKSIALKDYNTFTIWHYFDYSDDFTLTLPEVTN